MAWLSVLSGLVSAALKALPMLFAWLDGKRGAELDRLKENADARETADRVRRRLRDDPDELERMLDRWTRG